MSQHDFDLANAAGASFRADANLALVALAGLSSGATAPATTYAYMLWADTTGGWLKQRDAANAAWILRMPLGTGAAVDVASAATLDLTANAASSATLRITGTTATTAITLADGQHRLLRAAGAWPITHGASLICPGSASYTCAAGDLVLAIGEASSVVRLMIWKADGQAVVGSGITLATMQAATSGTAITFGSIPAGTKRITVMFDEVSTNSSASPVLLRLGDSGGIETTGYVSLTNATTATDGFLVSDEGNAADKRSGIVTLCLMNAATNKWVMAGTIGASNTPAGDSIGGVKSLSAELTQISITTSAGTATFDNGNINIAYE